MDLLGFVTARPGPKAYAEPFNSRNVSSQKIRTPVGNSGFDYVEEMPVPQSGMERAEWFHAHMRTPKSSTAAGAFAVCSPSGKPSIGAAERMVMGAERDDMLGAVVLRDNNWVNYNDPATEQSEAVAKIWETQTSASNGLWDGNYEVYVSDDSTTIWD